MSPNLYPDETPDKKGLACYVEAMKAMVKQNGIFVPKEKVPSPTSVDVVVKIRKNDTGEIREHKGNLPFYEGTEDISLYLYEEGNFSCDCNRRLFFERASDEFEEDDDFQEQVECGDGGYSVQIYRDGECIYDEFEKGRVNG